MGGEEWDVRQMHFGLAHVGFDHLLEFGRSRSTAILQIQSAQPRNIIFWASRRQPVMNFKAVRSRLAMTNQPLRLDQARLGPPDLVHEYLARRSGLFFSNYLE